MSRGRRSGKPDGNRVEVVNDEAAEVSSGIVADVCPSIRWTDFTATPACTARLAVVCRRSCGVRPGMPICFAGWDERTTAGV